MKLIRKAGVTSQIWQIFIQDKTKTDGSGLTGLVYNSGSLTAYYHRDTDTTETAITLVTMTAGTFTSSGFKEISATNMPGWYQFCPPNAAVAAGATSVAFHLKGATAMADLPLEVDLVLYDPQDLQLSANGNNAAADALLNRNVAGGSSTGRLVKEALYFLRNKWTLVGTALSVYFTDDSTVAWSSTVGTTPGADPISSNDPA